MLCDRYKKGTTEACHLCEIVTCGSEPCELTENLEPMIKECYGIIQPSLVWERWAKNPREVRAYRTTRPGQVRTFEGTVFYQAGDYLVEGIVQEVYPVREDIFKQSYDKLVDGCPVCHHSLTKEDAGTYLCPWCNTRWDEQGLAYHRKDAEMCASNHTAEQEHKA